MITVKAQEVSTIFDELLAGTQSREAVEAWAWALVLSASSDLSHPRGPDRGLASFNEPHIRGDT
jgi:hypothetical protein